MNSSSKDKKPQSALPVAVLEFIAAFVRSLKTGRLYATGHNFFKNSLSELFNYLNQALKEREFLFLGCAKENLFWDGRFYQAKDKHLKEFLSIFHGLGISHIFFSNKISPSELESFIEILAGAKTDQGEEIPLALSQHNIKNASVGLLDYTLLFTVQSLATRLAKTEEDLQLWWMLLLQPVITERSKVAQDRIKRLVPLLRQEDNLKALIFQLKKEIIEKHPGLSLAQQGMFLGNFLHNLGTNRKAFETNKGNFARHLRSILNMLDPELRVHILGSFPSDSSKEAPKGLTHEILNVMSDREAIYLLIQALKTTGSNNLCFNNLLQGVLSKYKDSAVILSFIRHEMNRATQERKPGAVNDWQYLEQILIERQEIETFNAQYDREISALTSSIHMKVPMVEDEELQRLSKTMHKDFLEITKAELIIDSIRNTHSDAIAQIFFTSLLEELRLTFRNLLKEKEYYLLARMLREIFFILIENPKDPLTRKSLNTWFNTDQIRELLESLFERFGTSEFHETSFINSICQLYPQKAGTVLLDMHFELDQQEGPKAEWLLTTLVSLGPDLKRPLFQKLQKAPDELLPKVLRVVSLCANSQFAPSVEKLLNHKDHRIRIEAIRTLGYLKSDKSVRVLSKILMQKSLFTGRKTKEIQREAARSLAHIGTDEAMGTLYQVIEKGPSDLKKICEDILGQSE